MSSSVDGTALNQDRVLLPKGIADDQRPTEEVTVEPCASGAEVRPPTAPTGGSQLVATADDSSPDEPAILGTSHAQAENLFRTASTKLGSWRQVVIGVLGDSVDVHCGSFCRKGELPTVSVGITDFNALISGFGRFLGNGVGLVLKLEENGVAYGLHHPPTFVCSREELVAPFVAWMQKPPRFLRKRQAQDREDVSSDVYAVILEKLTTQFFVLQNPVAYFNQAARNRVINHDRNRMLRARISRDRLALQSLIRDVDQTLEIQDEMRAALNSLSLDRGTIIALREEMGLVDPDGVLAWIGQYFRKLLPRGLFAFFTRLVSDTLANGKVNATQTAIDLGLRPSAGTVYLVRIREILDRYVKEENA